MKRRVALVAAGLLVASANAFATPVASGSAKSTDISRAAKPKPAPVAAQASIEPSSPELLFAAADRDADGSVSFSELSAVAKESIARQLQKRFQQLDLNHDGRCTRAEVNLMSAARFARFDLNRDGAFTAAELARAMQPQVVERLADLRMMLDRDRDGRFSVAELTPQPNQATERLAQNKTSVPKAAQKSAPVSKVVARTSARPKPVQVARANASTVY